MRRKRKYKSIESIFEDDNSDERSKVMTKKNTLKNVKWLETPVADIHEPVDKTFRYQNDYESIWGMSPYTSVSERANINISDMNIIRDKMMKDGFELFTQNTRSYGSTYRFIDRNSRILVIWEDDTVEILFYHIVQNKKQVEKIYKMFMDKSTAPKNNNFLMIAQSSDGLYNEEAAYKAKPLKDNRFDLYYGASFPHEKFVSFFDDEADNLCILHGPPGSGKSNYLKHLISMTDKRVIYIPPSMLTVLSQPSFVSYMLSNRDSVLLIEDAEEVISTDRNSATQNLLGMTDGFLKDSLSLKIICTVNCDIGQIDPALLRKGRLHFEYLFDKLTKDEAQKLVDFCGLGYEVEEAMTLAEVFNKDKVVQGGSFEEKVIGFGNF